MWVSQFGVRLMGSDVCKVGWVVLSFLWVEKAGLSFLVFVVWVRQSWLPYYLCCVWVRHSWLSFFLCRMRLLVQNGRLKGCGHLVVWNILINFEILKFIYLLLLNNYIQLSGGTLEMQSACLSLPG